MAWPPSHALQGPLERGGLTFVQNPSNCPESKHPKCFTPPNRKTSPQTGLSIWWRTAAAGLSACCSRSTRTEGPSGPHLRAKSLASLGCAPKRLFCVADVPEGTQSGPLGLEAAFSHFFPRLGKSDCHSLMPNKDLAFKGGLAAAVYEKTKPKQRKQQSQSHMGNTTEKRCSPGRCIRRIVRTTGACSNCRRRRRT